MPTWVQIIAYLAFLTTVLISVFNPRYIDMRLVSEFDGDQFPLGGAIVEVEVGDRVLSMMSDERGRFPIPVSFANPVSSYVFVVNNLGQSPRGIELRTWALDSRIVAFYNPTPTLGF